jgi:hypothetical protein
MTSTFASQSFGACAANVRFPEGFSMRAAGTWSRLCVDRPALTNLGRRKPRGLGMSSMGEAPGGCFY